MITDARSRAGPRHERRHGRRERHGPDSFHHRDNGRPRGKRTEPARWDAGAASCPGAATASRTGHGTLLRGISPRCSAGPA